MSIEIPITKADVKQIIKQVKTQDEVICLDQSTHIKTLLVAKHLLACGENVKAKIVKGYSDDQKTD